MTLLNAASVAIHQTTPSTAISTLNAAGFMASILEPDESPAEIIAAWLPRLRRNETLGQDHMRAQADAITVRIWGAPDGSTRVTNDETEAEASYPDLQTAISALIARSKIIGRA